MTTHSFRSDPELDAAFAELGVTRDSGNRTAVIREAVIAFARDQADRTRKPAWQVANAKVFSQPDANGTSRLIIEIPEAGA